MPAIPPPITKTEPFKVSFMLFSPKKTIAENINRYLIPVKRLSENAHLLRYPHPSSLRRTVIYASFLGISEALHMDIFKQPP